MFAPLTSLLGLLQEAALLLHNILKGEKNMNTENSRNVLGQALYLTKV